MNNKYESPSIEIIPVEYKGSLLTGSQLSSPVANNEMEFCVKISNNKEDTLSAEKFSIGNNDGLKMCVTILDTIDYMYYIIQKSDSQALVLACINEKGEIYNTFKEWDDSKLNVLSSSTPNLVAMILNGRATRGDRVALIPVQDNNGKVYDCAVRVIDFNWNTSNHGEELGRCHSIACQMLSEIFEVLKELNEGDISKSQLLKIGAISLSETAQETWKTLRMINGLDTLWGG